MTYGQELINKLESEIELLQKSIQNRYERIDKCWTDMDDCFVSQRCEERGISNNKDKIDLIKNGGCAWFIEYATLDGNLVDAHWCNTYYGYKLKVKMPDGTVKWTTAETKKGLARIGLKKVQCKRPAWFKFHSSCSGMAGVMSGDYILFPSDINYATGEEASDDPIEVRDYEEVGA